MCGIVGIVESDLSRPVPLDELQRMVRTLVHRGPDEEGSVTVPGVGLAMRRLAIVDLAGGQQPFTNETGDIQLVGNGELYNHLEVRAELEALGHVFRSRSDIEVFVHGYEQWGAGILTRLRGMFAIAVWDGRTRTLFAARDRAGEKPLYWSLTPQGLRLASEIKALLIRPEVSRELDAEALDQFLTYEYIIAPRTIFEARAQAAAWQLPDLSRRSGRAVTRYWDAAAVPVAHVERRRRHRGAACCHAQGGGQPDDVRRAARRVPLRRHRLEHAGGVHERGRRQPINTFSMGFDDGSYNELAYAREVATAFRTHTASGR
jgi:asparagine synthase (glutamine-hydrolysing)